jgi:hypothetical protein
MPYKLFRRFIYEPYQYSCTPTLFTFNSNDRACDTKQVTYNFVTKAVAGAGIVFAEWIWLFPVNKFCTCVSVIPFPVSDTEIVRCLSVLQH